MDTDQLAFGGKKEMNLSIPDYIMFHSMVGKNDSDETFTVLFQS